MATRALEVKTMVKHGRTLELPVLGPVTLPPSNRLIYYAQEIGEAMEQA